MMKKYFVTYADSNFSEAKERIVKEALLTHEFDDVIAYGPEDVSERLRKSSIFNEVRGGGLWSWKPDVILKTLNRMADGDALVYCDAGCSIYPGHEWTKIWNLLGHFEIVASRIYQRNDRWTRREILEAFKCNGHYWQYCYQFMATIIIIKSPFVVNFVSEWRDAMIDHPEFVRDVTREERNAQHSSFIENRHDQAVYSALIYKYLHTKKIYAMWEHMEDNDIIKKQVIRATRLKGKKQESRMTTAKKSCKRLFKDLLWKPFVIAPCQFLFFKLNEMSK